MKALVTGAGGFLGRALVRLLVEQGHGVRALVRERGPAALRGLDVEEVRGDVVEAASLDPAVAGCDVVFHLAGVRRASRREQFLSVNAGGTRNLVDACLKLPTPPSRFVLAGSLTASGPSAVGRREEDPLHPVEWYGESKAEAERIAFAHPGRLPASVARPPRITGPGDRENAFLFRLVAGRVLLGLSGPPRPLSFVDVDDCARGMLLLAERSEAVGEAFFFAHESRTDLEGLQREIARALGVDPVRIPLSPRVLRLAAAAADAVGPLLGRRLPLNRKLAEQVLAPGWTCSTEKAERLLGFRARVGLADSVRRSAAWYREQGWI